MIWKQPIPTNLREVFCEDHLARLIYQELLLMTRNEKGNVNLKGQIINLERGECYYTTLYLSQITNRDRKSVAKAITRLVKVYNRLDNRTTPKGSISSIKNYDEVVGLDNRMDNTTDNRGTTEGQQRDTNKNDKSVESDKIVKRKKSKPKKSFENSLKDLEAQGDSTSPSLATPSDSIPQAKTNLQMLAEEDVVSAFISGFEAENKLVTPRLIEIFEVFYRHRMNVKTPLTSDAVNRFCKKWVKYPEKIIEEAVSRSVESGTWKGVFFDFYDNRKNKDEAEDLTFAEVNKKLGIEF